MWHPAPLLARAFFSCIHNIWASPRENLSLGFPTKRDSNQPAQLQRLAKKLTFASSKSRYDTFQKVNTKGLIRLHPCAGWAVPVLFAYPRRQAFSRRGPYEGRGRLRQKLDRVPLDTSACAFKWGFCACVISTKISYDGQAGGY